MGMNAGFATRRRTRGVIVALLLLGAAAAFDAGLWWRTAAVNAQIDAAASGASPASAPPPKDDAPAELRFAAAYRSAMQSRQLASATEREAALARYRPLQGDNALGQAARYNSANLLLRQAIEVRATLQPGQAIALLELAKEGYRDVLRHDPGFWEARYNLERAQRLLPDAEEEEPPASEPAPEAERAVTTMRGHSAGLP